MNRFRRTVGVLSVGALLATGLTVAGSGSAGAVSPASGVRYVLAENVPLRKSATSSARVLARLDSGIAVTLTGRTGSWLRVASGSKVGFVWASKMTSIRLKNATGTRVTRKTTDVTRSLDAGTSGLTTIRSIPYGTTVTLLAKRADGKRIKVGADGWTGWVPGGVFLPAGTVAKRGARWMNRDARVTSAYSTTSRVLTTARKNTRVALVAQKSTRSFIRIDNRNGWVSTSTLDVSPVFKDVRRTSEYVMSAGCVTVRGKVANARTGNVRLRLGTGDFLTTGVAINQTSGAFSLRWCPPADARGTKPLKVWYNGAARGVRAANSAWNGSVRLVAPTSYRFVSAPDFMNTDVGDVRSSAYYEPGMPNSTNDSYEQTLDFVLDTWKKEAPRSVLVAGDLVGGHWWTDTENTGVFGPRDTFAQKQSFIRNAGNLYFGTWAREFTEHDLRWHAAVGDHDIGDNYWRKDRNAEENLKYRSVRLYKSMFSSHIVEPGGYTSRPPAGTNAHRTAYATYLSPEVLLVTVDVFRDSGTGWVVELDKAQLTWLGSVLGRAKKRGVDWIIVQGHTPVLTPVRGNTTSGLTYRGGASSPFWQTLKKYGVDLYLSGEVHAVTLRRRDGITQVSHGAIFPSHSANYLSAVISGSRMRLTTKRFDMTDNGGPRLWQTDNRTSKPGNISYSGPLVSGAATLTKTNKLVAGSNTGCLDGRTVLGLAACRASRLVE